MSEAALDPAEESAGAGLAELFGAQLAQAQAYARLLATDGVQRGVIGPREVPRLWTRHLGNCAVVAPLIPPQAHVADVGSGAGLPGLVLAIVRPDLRITLIEPLLRRTTFLGEAVAALELTNVVVHRARAEDVTDRFDVVVSRAVAPLARLATWCLPLIRDNGTVLAIKGESAGAELADAENLLRRLGARSWEVVRVGEGVANASTAVVRIQGRASGGAGDQRRARGAPRRTPRAQTRRARPPSTYRPPAAERRDGPATT